MILLAFLGVMEMLYLNVKVIINFQTKLLCFIAIFQQSMHGLARENLKFVHQRVDFLNQIFSPTVHSQQAIVN